MKIAHYIGNHAADTLAVRAGWWITRKVQKGAYSGTTHCEAIHAEHADGTVTIASASLRDQGVRDKHVRLNFAHWRIVDVPIWDVRQSIDLLGRTRGAKYDLGGAIATVFIGSQNAAKWFCNEWVAHPFVRSSATFGPHQFHAVTLSIGRDVTLDFFGSRALK